MLLFCSIPAKRLERSRAFHSATVLLDGRLLLAGGGEVMQAGACAPGRELAATATPARHSSDCRNERPLK